MVRAALAAGNATMGLCALAVLPDQHEKPARDDSLRIQWIGLQHREMNGNTRCSSSPDSIAKKYVPGQRSTNTWRTRAAYHEVGILQRKACQRRCAKLLQLQGIGIVAPTEPKGHLQRIAGQKRCTRLPHIQGIKTCNTYRT